MPSPPIIRPMAEVDTSPQRQRLRFCKAFFELRDAEDAHLRLLADGALQLDPGGDPSVRWYLWRESRSAAGAARAHFLVRLRGERLVLEGPDPRSVGRGWRGLDRVLRPAAVARVAAGDDLQRFLPRRRRHSADRPETWSREHEARVLREFYAAFCRRWSTTPHPRLGGLTPREAATRPDLQERLEGLLQRMRRVEEERQARGMPGFSTDELRRALSGYRPETDADGVGMASDPEVPPEASDAGESTE